MTNFCSQSEIIWINVMFLYCPKVEVLNHQYTYLYFIREYRAFEK